MELETADGVRGTVELSRMHTLANTCRLEGERGTLEVGVWDPDPEVALEVAGRRLAGRVDRQTDGGAGFDFPTAFRRQLEAFAAAVRGTGEPTATGADGRRVIALIESCYARREPLSLPWLEPLDAVPAGA
jgi:predicted dehydrogenase